MKNSTDRLQAKTISEHKKEHKFMFQFVSHDSGKRSEPFVGNWDTIHETLKHVQPGERPNEEDYILLVAVLDGENTQIPATPLITVKTFKQFKNDQQSLRSES